MEMSELVGVSESAIRFLVFKRKFYKSIICNIKSNKIYRLYK